MALAYYDDEEAKVSKLFENTFGKLIGLGLVALAIVFMAMFLTYSVEDPSPMNVTKSSPTNALGGLGAYLADPLIQMLGRAVWIIPTVLFAWAIRRYFAIGTASIMNRILFLPLALVIASVFFATNSVSATWPFEGIGMGGIVGDQLLRILVTATPLPNGLALFLNTLLLAVVALLMTAYVAGYHRHELFTYLNKITRDLRLTWSQIRLMINMHRETRREALSRTAPHAEKSKHGNQGRFAVAGIATAMTGGIAALRSKITSNSTPRSTDRAKTLNIRDIFGTELGGAQTNPAGNVGQGPTDLVDFEAKFQSDNPAVRAAVAKRLAEHHQRLRDHGLQDAGKNRFDGTATSALFADEPIAAREPLVKSRPTRVEKLSKRAQIEAEPSFAFEPKEKEPEFEKPSLLLLQSPETVTRHVPPREALEASAKMLQAVLEDYGVKGEIVAVRPGPVVTMYELEPAAGIKASRIIGLSDDIARSMSALTARVATVPGRSVIGIELPNDNREMVLLREIFSKKPYGDSKLPLPLALGKDIAGEPIVANLAKMPHLLIAGTTGSGKSVAINTMILSLLYHASPEDVRLIMIDPKMLELSVYDGIPHLLSPVVTDPKKAVVALKWAVAEMEERYRKMSKMGVRNIDGYNSRVKDALDSGEGFARTVQTGFDDDTGEPIFETEEYSPEKMPYIVVIVDEMADLMLVAGKEIEACIQRLAQMARASGIHIIMATQRPSVDVITGTIKANFPTRISFQVTSKIDSRTILGEMGAEQLLGQGDMLYMAGGGRLQRVHGPFVSDEEVEEVVRHLKAQGEPVYESGVLEGPEEGDSQAIDAILGLGGGNGDAEDQLYDQAVMIVARDRKASTSYIQRKLSIGYNKAAKLVERMEEEGVISEANHVGKRDVLVPEIN